MSQLFVVTPKTTQILFVLQVFIIFKADMIKFHILIVNKISQIVFVEFFESVLSKKKNSRCPVHYIENSPDEELF